MVDNDNVLIFTTFSPQLNNITYFVFDLSTSVLIVHFIMSGFEIAGLALAVLPVLLSAAQRYNSCLGPFSRYKRFAKEARDYYKELEIQRTIFRIQCRNLLEEVVDHDAASSMLNSLTQKVWADKKLDEQLVQQLGESLEACIDLIDLIEQRLRDISGESQKFNSIVEQEKEVFLISFF